MWFSWNYLLILFTNLSVRTLGRPICLSSWILVHFKHITPQPYLLVPHSSLFQKTTHSYKQMPTDFLLVEILLLSILHSLQDFQLQHKLKKLSVMHTNTIQLLATAGCIQCQDAPIPPPHWNVSYFLNSLCTLVIKKHIICNKNYNDMIAKLLLDFALLNSENEFFKFTFF